MKINSFDVITIDLNEGEIKIRAYNIKENKIILEFKNIWYTYIELKVNDKELLDIIHSKFLDSHEKKELLLKRIINNNMLKTESLYHLNTDWD